MELWRLVRNSDQIEDLERYLVAYPEGRYAEIARLRIDRLHRDRLSRLEPGTAWREESTGMEFVWVPSGCFYMGCDGDDEDCDFDEKPFHRVCLDGFWIGRYEVTNAQFAMFVNHADSLDQPWFESHAQDPDSRIHGGTGRYYVEEKYERHPMVHVSWLGAVAFCKWLSKQTGYQFRLPSEVEWEYASRAAGQGEGLYAGFKDIDKTAWYVKNSGHSTHTVGEKKSNPLGIFDMSGNVWEWCLDVYDSEAYRYHGGRNPVYLASNADIYKDTESLRVLRGGSWFSDARYCRSSARSWGNPDSRGRYIGYRIVREP